MQKVILVGIVAFLLSIAQAEDSWIMNLPTDLKQVIDKNVNFNQSCEKPELEVVPINHYNDCLKELCGTPPEFTSSMDLFYKKLKTVEETSRDSGKSAIKFEENINKYFKVKNLAVLDSNDNKDKIRKEILKIKKEGVLVRKGQFSGVLILIKSRELFKNIKEMNGISYVDRKFIEKLSSVDKIRMNFLADKIDSFFKDPLFNIRFQGPKVFMRRKFPNASSLKEAIINYLDLILLTEKKNKISLGLLGTSELDFRLLKSKTEQGILSDIELTQIATEGFSVEFMSINVEFGDKFGDKIIEEAYKSVEKWLKSKSKNEILKLVNNQFDNKEKEKKEEEKKEKIRINALNICMESFHRNMKMLPAQDKIDKFKKLVAVYKNDFINNLNRIKGISGESIKVLKNNVHKITFQMPYSREKWKEVVLNNINFKIKEEEIVNARVEKDSTIKDVASFAIYSLINPGLFEEDEEDPEEEYSSDISTLCQEMEQEAFSDATYTALGSINLSYTLANGPTYFQRGVIYHEIAHNLEEVFNSREDLSKLTNASFKKNKECIMGLHTYVEKENREKYYSEDFADFIAMKVLPPKSTSMFCEFLTSENNEFNDKDFKNTDKDDDHSSMIFRILRGTIDSSGKLPVSCSQALKNDNSVTLPESCPF